MKKYIDTPLIYNYSNINRSSVLGFANLYFNSKSKEVGNYKCHSCNFNSSQILYKKDDILFDNSLIHHMTQHNFKPSRELSSKIKRSSHIKIKATFIKEDNLKKFVLDKNQILILDSLMYSGNNKSYIDKAKKFRYSEHAGLLDFDKVGLEKILISGRSNRQDKDDPEILLPQNMDDALDYEFMFHTHPATPYPGARSKQGILYEFPSVSDIYHFIEHYNIGETQGSMIIAPEGIYIIHSRTGEEKIMVKSDEETYRMIMIDALKLQSKAIEQYGTDYLNNDLFFKRVINDHKYIKEFNEILKKYLDDQIYVEYIARKKDKSGSYVIDKLIIELKPITKKKNH
jgi:hypothetical protein